LHSTLAKEREWLRFLRLPFHSQEDVRLSDHTNCTHNFRKEAGFLRWWCSGSCGHHPNSRRHTGIQDSQGFANENWAPQRQGWRARDIENSRLEAAVDCLGISRLELWRHGAPRGWNWWQFYYGRFGGAGTLTSARGTKTDPPNPCPVSLLPFRLLEAAFWQTIP
jgi:hypothetical protein